MNDGPSMPQPGNANALEGDWLDQALGAERLHMRHAVADDGFSQRVLLRIGQQQAARSAAFALDATPATALARERVLQQRAERLARWSRRGSIAGSLIAAGVLSVSGGLTAGTPDAALGWTLAGLVISAPLTAWALLRHGAW